MARRAIRRLVGDRGVRWFHFAQHVAGDYRRLIRSEGVAGAQHIAPHSIDLYERVVRAYVESPDCVFVSMRDLIAGTLHPDKVNVVLRHDVDAFPERLHLFYEVEARYHVTSTVYVLFSEADYQVADHREALQELQRLGFDVGLHTTAWGRDDQRGFFEREWAAFRDTLGFEPSTFTLHGYKPWSEQVVAERGRFMALVPELLRRHSGCAGTDYGRPDTLVISDSAFQGDVSRWPETPPPATGVLRGGTVKVLTHPNYWVPAA